MQRRHLFKFQVSNWWFQLYVTYFLNPLIEDYLESFDTPALAHYHLHCPFPDKRKKTEKKEVEEKQYLNLGD